MESFNYKISLKKNLNEDERKTLVKLYQPILGVQATSIYFTLIEEKEVLTKLTDLVFNEKRLMKLLKLTNTKLMEGIHKLEGIKLLKRTYSKAKDVINFQVQTPVDPVTFFDNLILNDMLKKALGEQDYEIVRYCYLTEDFLTEDDEKDLTISFTEAFPEETNEITLKNLEFEENKLKTQKSLQSDLIDFSDLELELIKNDLPPSILTKHVRKLLLDNVSFFNLNQAMLVDALIQTYDYETKSTNKHLLKLYLTNEISKKNVTERTNRVDQMKNEFKEMDPIDYLASLTGIKTSLTAQKMIYNLKTKNHLTNEVINCLLNYSVLKNNGKIIERYLFKIAETLNKKQITSLDETMEHLKTAHLYTVNKGYEFDESDEDRFADIHNDLSTSTGQNVELPEPNKYFII